MTNTTPATRDQKLLIDPTTGRTLTWGEIDARFAESAADAGIAATTANLDAWIGNQIDERNIEEYTPAHLRRRHGFLTYR